MPLFTLIARVPDKLLLVESMDTEDSDTEVFRKKGKQLFHRITSTTEPSGILHSDAYFYMYMIENEICYLTFCDKSYPKKLAYKFLEEIKNEFEIQHGAVAKQKRLRPFHFEQFDSFIQKTKKLYQDSKSSRNLSQVTSDLKDINKMLQQNIEDILERGAKIERVSALSDDLVNQTMNMERKTKDLYWQQILRSWGFLAYLIAFAVFVVVFLYWYRS